LAAGATSYWCAYGVQVVKFADGKGKQNDASQGAGLKRGNEADSAGLNKRANLGMVCYAILLLVALGMLSMYSLRIHCDVAVEVIRLEVNEY
jgi:hypothetical protein